jgi:hypothetical protein
MHMVHALGPKSYVKVETRNLPKSRVVWLNFEWLKENGIDIPSDGLTPEFETLVLKAFAWGVPHENDEVGLFGEKSKTFYADRYGGIGLGVNWGSGRAANAGVVQIKGIGVTPLVGENQAYDHAHGRASLEESIREAIWGEINHRELPFGSNRVIAIIDSGTYTPWQAGGREKNALIVREDPLRPAHFLKAEYGVGQKMKETEVARALEAGERLSQALPVPREKLPHEPHAKLIAQFQEYVTRMARQNAAAFAKKLYHGATSQSNYDISGKFLDYGTMTAQPGYGKIKIIDAVAAFGDQQDSKEILIESFINGLPEKQRTILKPELKNFLDLFKATYELSIQREMLLLAGFPKVIVQELMKSKHSVTSLRLAKAVLNVATKNPFKGNVDQTMPEKTTAYLLQEIIPELINSGLGKNPLKLKDLLNNDELRTELVEALREVWPIALRAAESEGVSALNLSRYMSEASAHRNSNTPELYRPNLQVINRNLVDDYIKTGDRTKVWDSISAVLKAATRNLKSKDPFEIVLSQTEDPILGYKITYAFNARSGKYHHSIELLVNKDGLVKVFDVDVKSNEFEKSKVRATTDQWKSHVESNGKRTGNSIRFDFETHYQGAGDLGQLEFVFTDQNHQTWWKDKANKNFNFSIRKFKPHGNVAELSCIGKWIKPITYENISNP